MPAAVAVVGLGCMFPGADGPEAFWQTLVAGENTTAQATDATYGAPPSAFHDPTGVQADSSPTLRGGYLPDDSRTSLHGGGFGWVLHSARQALGRAAVPDRTGLILGGLSLPGTHDSALYAPFYNTLLEAGYTALFGGQVALRAPDLGGGDLHASHGPGALAAAVAAALGINGPHFALDAACASSLYAVALAAWYLQTGRADVMLAAAVSDADPLLTNLGFAKLGGHPAPGRESRPLDADSDGLTVSEGAAAVALKRYADALRDGDPIYAVIRGAGLSNDGRGKHPLTPNKRGQLLALEKSYAAAGFAHDAVPVIECHATGTPLGDRTELRTLNEFYAGFPAYRPLIGSVKANTGHLLTAAGLASLLKLVLAMKYGLLPGTPGIVTPVETGNATIVHANRPWPDLPGQPRRAAVDSFGFGGVSAHMILEQSPEHVYQYAETDVMTQTQPEAARVPLAITGMSAHFGPLDGLDAYAGAIHRGEAALIPLPPTRWNGINIHREVMQRLGFEGAVPPGGYIEGFDFDFAAFKIPPSPDDEPIPQQLLMLKVADDAIRDAKLQPGANVGVIVALEIDAALHRTRARADLNWQIDALLDDANLRLTDDQRAELQRVGKNAVLPEAGANQTTSYIGNITASRIAAQWDFTGPTFTVSAGENSTFRALEVAAMMVAQGEVDAVVVGAVDLAGSPEAVLLRQALHPLNRASLHPAGMDADNSGWTVGEGAGAVVVTRADDAPPAYAIIEALALHSQPGGGTPSAETVAQAARAALHAAELRPLDVGYLEMHASGIEAEDTAEIEGLTTVYHGDAPETAVGTAKANVGHTFAAAGMAALIRAALAVSDRMLPSIPGWNAPELPEVWQGSACFVAQRTRTWFAAERHAAVSGLSSDGTAAHLILSNAARPRADRANVYLRDAPPYLFSLCGFDADDLTHKLAMLSAALDDDDLQAAADATYANFCAVNGAPLVLVLVGKDVESLRREIDRANDGVRQAIAQGSTWTTPAGSVFTARPVGEEGHIAFVYPGAFNTYPKLGYDLFTMFPGAYDALAAVKADVGEAVAERYLYPRTLAKPGPKETRRMKDALADDPVATIESGLSFATVYTHIMRRTFRVEPGAAFGYSLGEGSMMWGMGIWRDGTQGSAAFRSSDLFETRLAGPMNAVREAWGIAPDVDPSQFWAAYFISAPVEVVRQAVERESRVFLTHINTPEECMIAGDPAACYRVIETITGETGGETVKAPFSVVIHADVMMSEYGEYYRLHHLPVTLDEADGIRFYSAADYAPVPLQSEALAASVARMACKQVDFPRLIERAYHDGARVFVELGPRSTTARWINETLGDRPHLAASIDVLGAEGRVSLVKLLAQLMAHRVPVDVSPLFTPRRAQPAAGGRSLVRRIIPGGQDIVKAIADAQISGLPQGVTTTSAGAQYAASVQPAAMTTSRAAPSLGDAAVAAVHNAHTLFLDTRRDALRGMGEMIQMQIGGQGDFSAAAPPPQPQPEPPPPAPALPPVPPANPNSSPTLRRGITPQYDRHAIETFATGRIADCFGDKYAIYDGKRAPRIPNGDLLLVSRAVEIKGERFKSVPGTAIHAEYDVPADMWWYRDTPYPLIPYSMYMEIALQPCGFLSAYHGPTLDFPDVDFYFRNLDGTGRLYRDVDMRGRTITNHVTLTGSTVMQGIIIQKYTFALFDEEELFYEGDAAFGYFTLEALDSQAGLDAGKRVPRWIDEAQPDPAQVIHVNPHAPLGAGYLTLGSGKLEFTDEIKVIPGGGRYGQGYAYANTIIDPNAWYFKNHFHQDPVMPGSIGLETVHQAMQAYAIETGLADDFTAPRFAQVDGPLVGQDAHTTVWKYRGQILSSSEKSHVEANIKEIRREPGRVVMIADASLWRDALRIYEAKDIALAIVEA